MVMEGGANGPQRGNKSDCPDGLVTNRCDCISVLPCYHISRGYDAGTQVAVTEWGMNV